MAFVRISDPIGHFALAPPIHITIASCPLTIKLIATAMLAVVAPVVVSATVCECCVYHEEVHATSGANRCPCSGLAARQSQLQPLIDLSTQLDTHCDHCEFAATGAEHPRRGHVVRGTLFQVH